MRNTLKTSTVKKTNKKAQSRKLTFKKIKIIFGVGSGRVQSYVKKFGLSSSFVKKVKINKLRIMDQISFKLTWDKNLINKLIDNRKFLVETIKNYRGIRHLLRYPSRGQRTKTNSSTRKKIKGDKVQYLT